MPDASGLPLLADLAAMRDAMARLGGAPADINPLTPIDLVIDHSITVDVFGRKDAFARNLEIEYARNRERYAFFKWAQNGLRKLRILQPALGTCHQVHITHHARVVWT